MTHLGSLLVLLCYVSGAAAQTSAATEKVDRFIRVELARQRIPGMAVAVLRGDSVLLARGYGLADQVRRSPATDSTLFAVGSVSKQFTAAAIVLLSQQGRLGLDDPITRYPIASLVSLARNACAFTPPAPQGTAAPGRQPTWS